MVTTKSAKKAGGERRELIYIGASKRYMKRKRDGTFKEGVAFAALIFVFARNED